VAEGVASVLDAVSGDAVAGADAEVSAAGTALRLAAEAQRVAPLKTISWKPSLRRPVDFTESPGDSRPTRSADVEGALRTLR
jgi:hypothetical protein